MNMRDLPLNALRVLAAIYETEGVRAAGRLLQVSPSAIHRQLRELEGRLTVPLVETASGSIRFTAEGERLARQAQQALATLIHGFEEVREDRRSSAILLATSDSFASRWLIPRLPRLRAAYPKLALSLITGRRVLSIPREANLAIRMGAGPWPETICEPLMDDEIFPVAAPAFWSQAATGEQLTISDILRLPRIHDRDPQAGWRRWGAAFGIGDADVRAGIRITSSDLSLSAAALGLGVAMARGRLAAGALARGELNAAIGLTPVAVGPAYWVIRPPALRAIEEEFLIWLRAEAEAAQPVES